jgi:hypothetical protein
VESPIAAVEPVLDEWKKYAIFFLGTMEESTNMTLVAELRAGEMNRVGFGVHESSPDARRFVFKDH